MTSSEYLYFSNIKFRTESSGPIDEIIEVFSYV